MNVALSAARKILWIVCFGTMCSVSCTSVR